MEQKNFFQQLMDFSFQHFIAVKIARILYGIAVIGCIIWAAIGFFGGMAGLSQGGYGSQFGALGMILIPIAAFVMLCLARIWMELLIVQFRIAENTTILVERTKGKKTE
jgi:uncharacterized membrane protein